MDKTAGLPESVEIIIIVVSIISKLKQWGRKTKWHWVIKTTTLIRLLVARTSRKNSSPHWSVLRDPSEVAF